MTVRDSATRPVHVILSAAKNLPSPPRSFAALRMTVCPTVLQNRAPSFSSRCRCSASIQRRTSRQLFRATLLDEGFTGGRPGAHLAAGNSSPPRKMQGMATSCGGPVPLTRRGRILRQRPGKVAEGQRHGLEFSHCGMASSLDRILGPLSERFLTLDPAPTTRYLVVPELIRRPGRIRSINSHVVQAGPCALQPNCSGCLVRPPHQSHRVSRRSNLRGRRPDLAPAALAE